MPRIRKIRGQDIDISLNKGDIDKIIPRTPEKTGKLKGGFTIDNSGRIVNPVFYGDWQERGFIHHVSGKRIPGKFMVFDSIPEIAERFEKRVADQLDAVQLLDLPKIK